jgi:hypothetical protein
VIGEILVQALKLLLIVHCDADAAECCCCGLVQPAVCPGSIAQGASVIGTAAQNSHQTGIWQIQQRGNFVVIHPAGTLQPRMRAIASDLSAGDMGVFRCTLDCLLLLLHCANAAAAALKSRISCSKIFLNAQTQNLSPGRANPQRRKRSADRVVR